VVLRRPQRLTRYVDVALLAAALDDEILARSRLEIYVTPLGDRGSDLRATLRVLFTASRSTSSAARSLGDWEPGVLTFYYDGARVGEVKTGYINSTPQYLIMTEVAPGSYGGELVVPDESPWTMCGSGNTHILRTAMPGHSRGRTKNWMRCLTARITSCTIGSPVQGGLSLNLVPHRLIRRRPGIRRHSYAQTGNSMLTTQVPTTIFISCSRTQHGTLKT
jgi:hypothetical protein